MTLHFSNLNILAIRCTLPLFNVSLKKHKNSLNLELLNVYAFMNCCRVSQQTVQHLNIKEVSNPF